MAADRLSSADARALSPAGTVMHNPVSGEYARVVTHTAECVVGELLAVPGGAVRTTRMPERAAKGDRFALADVGRHSARWTDASPRTRRPGDR